MDLEDLLSTMKMADGSGFETSILLKDNVCVDAKQTHNSLLVMSKGAENMCNGSLLIEQL